MDSFGDLEIDVNGEAVFMVDKKRISSYSGRLSHLFGKSASTGSNFKVIFHDFPGGAETFELVARFCYNNGSIEISPTNLSFLHSAAYFMEMSRSVSGTENLIELTEKALEEISYWTWPDLLLALKQNQNLPEDVKTAGVVQKCLDTLVGRLAVAAETSPCPSTSSPESFGFRISCDSRSTESLKTSCSRANWWFEDLSVLNQNMIELAVKSMVSRKLDHGTIGRFLLHYQKLNFISAQSDEKCRIIEMVVNNLCSLDHWSVPFKNLMGLLRILLNLNVSKCTRSRLEGIIGLRMDEATLDNLLVPSPQGMNYLYDVNLVLRLLKSFLGGGLPKVSNDRIVRVAHLLDSYLAEVAPDPCLRPSKFIALATALPDSSRDSYDEMYHAMDMYLEVHTDLTEEETFNICSALNYEKLSAEACVHLSKNAKFPSSSTVQALISQQTKLESLLHDANYPKSCSSSPGIGGGARSRKDDSSQQIVLYAGKFDVMTENENIRAHLQGMQCRVTELEKVCQKMQTQVAKMMRSKSSNNMNPRSLPRFCS
ncbi:BTB/POZ domain-containing protein At3g22104-like isoform X1 [Chenopodium quinoa]|uniref:NPH3 domain-containing protein n=2 Tax=Chenopodium quinoa TaxID=63459 RepID=A0A803M8B6_CHEQI|nr:BTB/POZ domain-containing protein At3g22104-like isoform X1 [Chenopodium quinoa]